MRKRTCMVMSPTQRLGSVPWRKGETFSSPRPLPKPSASPRKFPTNTQASKPSRGRLSPWMYIASCGTLAGSRTPGEPSQEKRRCWTARKARLALPSPSRTRTFASMSPGVKKMAGNPESTVFRSGKKKSGTWWKKSTGVLRKWIQGEGFPGNRFEV